MLLSFSSRTTSRAMASSGPGWTRQPAHRDHWEPSLFMLGQSPFLGVIENKSQLHPILNNPQTEHIGKRPVDDHFYPPSSFYTMNTAKVDDPSGYLWLGVHEDCQPAGRIRYPSLFVFYFLAISTGGVTGIIIVVDGNPIDVDQTCQLSTNY
jgi:hypothetical protein